MPIQRFDANNDPVVIPDLVGTADQQVADSEGTIINPSREDGNLATLVARTNTLGQKILSESMPVAIASNQSPVPVSISGDTTNQPTYYATAQDVTMGLNKSMLSILNFAFATQAVKIYAIYIINSAIGTITGLTADFRLHRITGHSGGTNWSIASADTGDISGSVGIKSGATVSGETTPYLMRRQWSADEFPQVALDNEIESSDHSFQNMFPLYKRQDKDEKPITLSPGQGLSVKQITNSIVGQFDIMVIFTGETF